MTAPVVTRLIDMGIEPFLISSTRWRRWHSVLYARYETLRQAGRTRQELLRIEFGVSESETSGTYMRGEGCENVCNTSSVLITIYEILASPTVSKR